LKHVAYIYFCNKVMLSHNKMLSLFDESIEHVLLN